jgi:hypothetical protein
MRCRSLLPLALERMRLPDVSKEWGDKKIKQIREREKGKRTSPYTADSLVLIVFNST